MIFLRSDPNPEWSREHFPILKSKLESKNAKLFFHHFLSNPLILQPVVWAFNNPKRAHVRAGEDPCRMLGESEVSENHAGCKIRGFDKKIKYQKPSKMAISYRHEPVCSDLGAEFNSGYKSPHAVSWRPQIVHF